MEKGKTVTYKYRIEWIIVAATMLILFVNTAYSDFFVTTRHGLTVWTALFDGRLLDFYSYCNEGMPGFISHNGAIDYYGSAAYDFTIYGIFAIWNFPLWLLERFANIDVQTQIWAILYSKVLILLFFFFCVKGILRLCDILGIEKVEQVLLLFCSSVCLFTYTIGTGNYDVIECAFAIAGVNALAEEKHGKFLIWFAIANSIKYLTFFIFVPLVLFENKKIRFIIRDIVIGIIPISFSKLLFSSDANTTAGTQLVSSSVSDLFGSNFMGSASVVNIFVVAYVGVCLLAFFWNKETAEKRQRTSQIVYLVVASYSLFLFTTRVHPYWSVILLPFLYVLLGVNTGTRKFNIFIETITMIMLQFSYFMKFPHIPYGPAFSPLPVYQLFGKIHCLQRGEFISGYAVGTLLSSVLASIMPELITNSIAFLGIVILLTVNYPGHKKEMDSYIPQWKLDQILRVRLWWNSAVALLPMIIYIAQMVFYDWLAARF